MDAEACLNIRWVQNRNHFICHVGFIYTQQNTFCTDGLSSESGLGQELLHIMLYKSLFTEIILKQIDALKITKL